MGEATIEAAYADDRLSLCLGESLEEVHTLPDRLLAIAREVGQKRVVCILDQNTSKIALIPSIWASSVYVLACFDMSLAYC